MTFDPETAIFQFTYVLDIVRCPWMHLGVTARHWARTRLNSIIAMALLMDVRRR
jgi:hypothetical protein